MACKATRFARAFEPWVDRWAEMGLSARQMQVLLKLITVMERQPNGEYRAARSRSDIAESLGISEKAVKNTIQALKERGAIKPIGPSHPGKAQTYVIMPRDLGGKGLPKINEKRVPESGSNGYPDSGQMGTQIRAIRVPESRYPIRNKEDGASASLSQPSAEEEERRRRYAERIAGIV